MGQPAKYPQQMYVHARRRIYDAIHKRGTKLHWYNASDIEGAIQELLRCDERYNNANIVRFNDKARK